MIQTMNSVDADKWKAAKTEEYYALIEKQTWEETQLPEGKKPI